MCILWQDVDVGEEVLEHESVVRFGMGRGKAHVFILVVEALVTFIISCKQSVR